MRLTDSALAPPSKELIRLHARDGCEREMYWPVPLPQRLRFVLHTPARWQPQLGDETLPLPCREYEILRHAVRHPFTGDIIEPAQYREVCEVVAERPSAPKLTNDEWADAVARFGKNSFHDPARHPDDAERRASWVRADQDFLKRHDGGTVICHSSGLLMGVFYVAPTWDASDECVRFWSALRSLMEQQP